MDPITAVTSAQEIASVCTAIVRKVKAFIEAVKGAKQAMIDMLNRLERMRLLVNEFKNLAQRLVNSPEHTVTLAFDEVECTATLRRVQLLINRVVEQANFHEYWMRANWIRHKDEADKLLARLANHEMDLGTVLQFIAARYSVATEQGVQTIVAHLASQPVLVEPFLASKTVPSTSSMADTPERGVEIYSLPGNESSSKADTLVLGRKPFHPLPAKPLSQPRQWLLCTASDMSSADYVRHRDKLSNAAHSGTWNAVLNAIDMGRKKFGEEWANAPRLKPSSELERQSMWTPLHQAAYMGASRTVVERLLALGASRECLVCSTTMMTKQLIRKPDKGTIRTRMANKGLPYHDMTAFDIAESLGYTGLLDILTPIIIHYLPAPTLAALQSQLESLIRQISSYTIPSQSIRLPDMSVLMELKNPLLDLVLPRSTDLGSFFIFLDKRDVLLQYNTRSGGALQESLCRINMSGWCQIENAVSLRS